MPRRKGSKSKRPYPQEARKKQSVYKKLIAKMGKKALENELSDSEPDEYYYDDEEEVQTTPENETEPQTDLLQEMTGLKEKLSQYEEQLNEYRDLAKEHREFLAEQKALRRKIKEEAELNKRADLLAEEKMRKLRKKEYKYEVDALSALLF